MKIIRNPSPEDQRVGCTIPREVRLIRSIRGFLSVQNDGHEKAQNAQRYFVPFELLRGSRASLFTTAG
jgi:hypothetical protein